MHRMETKAIAARSVIGVALLAAAPGLSGCESLGIPRPEVQAFDALFGDGALESVAVATANSSLGLSNSNRDRVLANLAAGAIGQAIDHFQKRQFEEDERRRAEQRAKQVVAQEDRAVLESTEAGDADLFVPYDKKTLEDGTVVILYARANTDGTIVGDDTYEISEEEANATIAKQRENSQLTTVDDTKVLMLEWPPEPEDEVV
ncbi:MAG: hypothetical protein ACTS22_07435 [Phycisphaerales bacterium]